MLLGVASRLVLHNTPYSLQQRSGSEHDGLRQPFPNQIRSTIHIKGLVRCSWPSLVSMLCHGRERSARLTAHGFPRHARRVLKTKDCCDT